MSIPRMIAFYLPQFHPIPENDKWWGKGFTEWTNVGKARKLFPGHDQPRVPADLGYYDLRLSEVREAQAALAKEAGIEGFCYWHYWFGNGKKLLEKPFQEVLASGKPDFPFCLAWANESWYEKLWSKDGNKDKLLIEQTYNGYNDYYDHFYYLLPAFLDKRYIRINNKPVFVIYKPLANSEISLFISTWQKLAKKEKLEGIFFIGHCFNDSGKLNLYKNLGLDAINVLNMNGFSTHNYLLTKILNKTLRSIFKLPFIVSYRKVCQFINSDCYNDKCLIPSIFTGWDHTPRSGRNGTVMVKYTPEVFNQHLQEVVDLSKKSLYNIAFIKSWNEWAEGNYLEPDLRHGNAFLKQFNKVLDK